MGSLVRDNKILLSKLARGIYKGKNFLRFYHLRSMSVNINLNSFNIVTLLPIEKEDIEFVEVKDCVYICLNIDRMCKVNRARLLIRDFSSTIRGSVSFDEFFKQYFKDGIEDTIRSDFDFFKSGNRHRYIFDSYLMVFQYLNDKTNYNVIANVIDDEEFEEGIQYVIDDVISYMKDITYKFLYESFEKYLNSKTVFNLSRDSYYENGLLGVIKVDFKNFNFNMFDGDSTVTKITFSNKSHSVCSFSIDSVLSSYKSLNISGIITSSFYVGKDSGSNYYKGDKGYIKLSALW